MRTMVFLNQMDSQPDARPLRHLAESILSKGQGQIERVILGQLKPKIRCIVSPHGNLPPIRSIKH